MIIAVIIMSIIFVILGGFVGFQLGYNVCLDWYKEVVNEFIKERE